MRRPRREGSSKRLRETVLGVGVPVQEVQPSITAPRRLVVVNLPVPVFPLQRVRQVRHRARSQRFETRSFTRAFKASAQRDSANPLRASETMFLLPAPVLRHAAGGANKFAQLRIAGSADSIGAEAEARSVAL